MHRIVSSFTGLEKRTARHIFKFAHKAHGLSAMNIDMTGRVVMRKSIWLLILSAAMGVGAPAWAGDFSISLKHIPSWDGAQLSAVVLVVILS